MSMMQTYRSNYLPLFPKDLSQWITATDAKVTADGSIGYYSICLGVTSFCSRIPTWANKHKYAKEIGPEWNNVEIIMPMNECVTSGVCSFRVYGWTEGSPALLIADVSAKAGKAFADTTSNVFAGGFSFCFTTSQMSDVSALPISSDASNQVARLRFNTFGLKYIFCDPYDMTQQTKRVNFWMRGY
jgi:hypothetical protein